MELFYSHSSPILLFICIYGLNEYFVDHIWIFGNLRQNLTNFKNNNESFEVRDSNVSILAT